MTKRRTFGTVRRLASGRFQARYRTPAGVLVTAPRTFTSKTDATRYLSTVETDLLRGTWKPSRELCTTTVDGWCKRYLDSRVDLRPSTMASYRSLFACCIEPRLGDRALPALTKTEVREWVAALTASGLGGSRVRKALVLLSMALEAAVDDELIDVNPAQRVKSPRLPMTEPRVLTTTQVDLLADAIAEQYRLPVLLLAYGGLRFGELRALRRRSIDVLHGRLVVAESVAEVAGHFHFDAPKSDQPREIALPPFLLDELKAHLETVPATADALLFPSRAGTPMRYKTFQRAWRAALLTAKLPGVTPHDLRASCGSWVAEQFGVMAAAKRLGHSSASVTTRHYARARQGVDEDVARAFETARAPAESASNGTPVARKSPGNLRRTV